VFPKRRRTESSVQRTREKTENNRKQKTENHSPRRQEAITNLLLLVKVVTSPPKKYPRRRIRHQPFPFDSIIIGKTRRKSTTRYVKTNKLFSYQGKKRRERCTDSQSQNHRSPIDDPEATSPTKDVESLSLVDPRRPRSIFLGGGSRSTLFFPSPSPLRIRTSDFFGGTNE